MIHTHRLLSPSSFEIALPHFPRLSQVKNGNIPKFPWETPHTTTVLHNGQAGSSPDFDLRKDS